LGITTQLPKFIEASVLSIEQDADHGTGYVRLDQPLWSGCLRIENLIEGHEFGAFRGPTVRDACNRK